MVAEARLKSKNLYKVELYLLKIMPMVIALAYLVNTVSSYFGVDIPILASIAGMSLIPLKIVDDIDAGNSNITEGEAIEIVDNLRRFTDKEKRLSKYAACEYLNVSRATFDNYVREGKLPRGKHEIGFKELSWNKKTLDEFIRRSKHEK